VPFALAVGLLVSGIPVIAGPMPVRPAAQAAPDYQAPDMSQSEVQRRQPRPFEQMPGVTQVSGLERANATATLAAGVTQGDSEFSRTIDNGDGSYSTTMSLDPINWQDPAGTWRPFDDTIVPVAQTDAAGKPLASDGFGYVNHAGPFDVRFATADGAKATGQLVDLTSGRTSVDVLLPGTEPTTTDVTDDVLTFSDTGSGADIRYRVEQGTLKEEIILAKPPTEKNPARFPFELRLDGLTATQGKDGIIKLADEQGAIVYTIPASTMLDGDETLSPDVRLSMAVTTTLSAIAPGRVLVMVIPDPKWLADPARTYPVVIDPTFHYGTGRSDTSSSTSVMIQQANATTNYSGVSPLTIGKTAGGQGQEALVTFPTLDVVPRDATVVKASMAFTVSSGTAGMGMEVRQITSAWNPATVTWNLAPTHTANKTMTTAIGANTVTLTQLVLGWGRASYPNYGVRLRSTGSSGQSIVVPGSGAGSPALTVTYIKQLRLGVDDLYGYTSYDYGGDTAGMVNAATGNLVLQHTDSSIGVPGFTVDLTHTFNGQDPYGQHKAAPDSWAVYGEGWSFSQDWRLFEIPSGDSAVVFKDGTGRIRVFTHLNSTGGVRTYSQPIQYGYTLTKDINASPADPNKIWTLTSTQGGEKAFFESGGKLTRREDRNGNYLTYAYDGSGRLTTITDEIGRTTTFDYTSGSGSPTRLHSITDMAGRITDLTYDSYGNLTIIKDAYGSAVQRSTTFGYALADQLATVTSPTGSQFVIDYDMLHGWEGATTEGWAIGSGSTGTVVRSTTQAYKGSGSLKVTLGSSGVALNDEVVEPFSPSKSYNSAPQEILAFVYVASGAPAINATLRASNSCSGGSQTSTAALTAGGWNELHLESVDQDPTCPLTELGVRFATPGGQTYMTPMYIDHLYMRGRTLGVRDAIGAHTVFQQWSFDPANRATTVGLLDAVGIMQPTTYRYTDVGEVDQVTDPYSNVTTTTYDNDWRPTSIAYPGIPSRTDTFTYASGVMAWETATTNGATSHMGADAATGDERYQLDSVNEGRRVASLTFVATIYNRDAAGRITSRKLNWYSAGANLDTVPFPSPTSTLETTSYTYTSDGMVATTTDPLGAVAKDEYDTATRHTKDIDNYVPGGLDPDENLTTLYVYNTAIVAGKAGLVTQSTDPTGAVTDTTYDDLGHQLSTTKTGTGLGAGIVTATTNDANGSVVSKTLDGIVTEHTYDANGRHTKLVVDKGSGKLNLTTEYAYDLQGNQIAKKDSRGTITRSWYDANRRLIKTVANCTTTGTTLPSAWETCTGAGTADATWNLTATYGYDSLGNQTSEIAPNGAETRNGYDSNGSVIWTTDNYAASTTSPDQNLTTYFYFDDLKQDVATKAPTLDRTTFVVTRRTYDDQGRVSSEIVNCTDSGTTAPINPATCTGAGTANATTNIITTYAYDAAGNQVAVTAPKSSDSNSGTNTATTRYAYDGGGRLCRVLEAATTNLQALADPCSTAVSGTTTSDLSTRYTYDSNGNLASAIDARGDTQSYAYDGAGRMTSRTDGLGNMLIWTFDRRGNQLTQANRVGTPAVAITWTYDNANRMLTRVADTVTTTYGYDAKGNVTSAQGPAGTISTTFDRLDRPTDVTPDDGSTHTVTTYSFTAPTRSDAAGPSTFALDKFGRETSATLPLSGSAFLTTYRADGELSTRTDPNANVTSNGYDTIGRLLTKVTTGSGGTPTRASLTFTYNRAGLRLSEASTVSGDPANGTATFTSDALGRLTGYTSPLGTSTNQAYGWQQVPNRDSLTIGTGSPTTLTYDAADRVTTSGYSHDLDGRMTGQPGQTMAWDSLGRLKEVRNSSTTALISTYTYDALDRLRTVARSGATIRFRYLGTSTQVSEVVDDGTGTSQLKVGNGWGGARLATWTGSSSNPRYYGSNGHGDVTWLADGSGAVVVTLRYDSWGNVAAASGATLPDWRYQGSWSDTATGISWAVTRWYAPGLGHFISEDSLLGGTANPDSRHLYAYGTGAPMDSSDPAGQISGTRDPHPPKYRSWTIDNPKGLRGKFVLSLFIAECAPFIPPVTTKGDCRGFKWGGNCSASRSCITIDYDTNKLTIRMNKTCIKPFITDTQWQCHDPLTIHDGAVKQKWNYVTRLTNEDRWYMTQIRFGVAQSYGDTVVGPGIDGFLTINPRVFVLIRHESFPSYELYYTNGATKRVYRESEDGAYLAYRECCDKDAKIQWSDFVSQ